METTEPYPVWITSVDGHAAGTDLPPSDTLNGFNVFEVQKQQFRAAFVSTSYLNFYFIFPSSFSVEIW